MDREARILALEEEVRRLKQDLRSRDEQIENLTRMSELFDIYEEMSRQELLESKQTIQAQESVIELTSQERKEARQTMEVFRNLQELSQDELLHKSLALQHILKINKEIASIPRKEILLGEILGSIMPVLGAERGILFLTQEERLVPAYVEGLTREEIDPNIHRRCLQLLRTNQTGELPDSLGEILTTAAGRHAAVFAPLRHKTELLGLLYLDRPGGAAFSPYDLDTIAIFSAQASIAIQNSNLYYHLEKEVLARTGKLREAYENINRLYQVIESDLSLAKKVQTSLLPRAETSDEFMEVGVLYRPMSKIGGDIYDIYRPDPYHLRILLADATGHGIQAALVTMLIKSEYEILKRDLPRPEEVLERLNRAFIKNYYALTIIFSAVLVDIDFYAGTLTYCAGGHLDQYILREFESEVLSNTGNLIGVIEDSCYEKRVFPFGANDRLLLFTDGLTEQVNDSETEFGEERLLGILRADKSAGAGDDGPPPSGYALPRLLVDELRKFSGRDEFDDDLTILSVLRRPDAEAKDRRNDRNRRASVPARTPPIPGGTRRHDPQFPNDAFV